jgi:transcriptional regulator with XRE-family HTH domain
MLVPGGGSGMEKRKLIGKRIKEVRRAKKLSQEQLAERVGIDAKYVGFIEQGRGNPTLQVLIKMADALRVDIDALFNYRWATMSDAEVRKRLHGLIDRSSGEALREITALLRSRDL